MHPVFRVDFVTQRIWLFRRLGESLSVGQVVGEPLAWGDFRLMASLEVTPAAVSTVMVLVVVVVSRFRCWGLRCVGRAVDVWLGR